MKPHLYQRKRCHKQPQVVVIAVISNIKLKETKSIINWNKITGLNESDKEANARSKYLYAVLQLNCLEFLALYYLYVTAGLIIVTILLI